MSLILKIGLEKKTDVLRLNEDGDSENKKGNKMGKYDLIVLGAGPAGYSAAIRAVQLGKKVLLIEEDKIGGTCLNRGCIPTKYLWETLHLYKRINRAKDYGISAQTNPLEFEPVQQKSLKNIEMMGKGLKKLLDSYNLNVLEGKAEIKDPNSIRIITGNNEKEIRYDKLIIATGSRAKDLPSIKINHDNIIDSTDILNLKAAPKSLLIIGGGVIGVELANIFSKFSESVIIVEKESQILPEENAEFAEEVQKILERAGVEVKTSFQFSDEILSKYEKVLLAVGRSPNIEALGLEKNGIKVSKNGIDVNEYLQTAKNNIYAAGDVTGNSYLAYIAQADGVRAVENAFGGNRTADYKAIPKIIFSDPPAASVGNTSDTDDEIISGKFPFSANSRAVIENERIGWVKIYINKSTNQLVGGQMVGPHAEELIEIISVGVKNKLKAESLSREVFFHPSLSEAIHCACEDALNKCVDLPKK
ncbi:dihydrolipoyl dehydrogenase [Elusimicrobiota bacterium]